MNRQDVVDMVADYYGIETDDNGHANEESYAFQSGCSIGNGTWLTLSSVVDCICTEFWDLMG